MSAKLFTLPKVFQPEITLLVKLGSVIVHAQELASPDGHLFDRVALEELLKDPEVAEWMQQMNDLALLPVRRKP